jgi:hypothetical protein
VEKKRSKQQQDDDEYADTEPANEHDDDDDKEERGRTAIAKDSTKTVKVSATLLAKEAALNEGKKKKKGKKERELEVEKADDRFQIGTTGEVQKRKAKLWILHQSQAE